MPVLVSSFLPQKLSHIKKSGHLKTTFVEIQTRIFALTVSVIETKEDLIYNQKDRTIFYH